MRPRELPAEDVLEEYGELEKQIASMRPRELPAEDKAGGYPRRRRSQLQ